MSASARAAEAGGLRRGRGLRGGALPGRRRGRRGCARRQRGRLRGGGVRRRRRRGRHGWHGWHGWRCGGRGGRLGRRGGGRDPELAERLGGHARPEVVLLALRLRLVRGGDHLAQRRVHGDVRVDLLAGHELELVDHLLVVRVGHRQEDAVAAHEHGQDAVALGNLRRDDVEVVEDDRHLGEIDARHAVLLGERAQRLDLVDLSLVDQLRREGRRRGRLALAAKSVIQLLLRNELALQQDLPERPLVVAGHGRACTR